MRTALRVARCFALLYAPVGTNREVKPSVVVSQLIWHTFPGSVVSLNTSCFSVSVRDMG